jgi:hypothetical protein
LQEQQAPLKLYLNGKVEQFWLREDGKGAVFLMATSTREEAVENLPRPHEFWTTPDGFSTDRGVTFPHRSAFNCRQIENAKRKSP